MTEEFKRPTILDELDNFNTAPKADSLMEGILLEEEANIKGTTTLPAIEEETTTETTPKKELPNDYLPLNSSIQDLRGQVEQRLNTIERSISQKLDSLTNAYSQRQKDPEPQYTQADYDTPVTLGQLSPVTQRVEAANNMAMRAFVRSEISRAHLEYERYKHTNPKFDLNPQDIDSAVTAMVQNGKLGELENVNWRGHFDLLYRPKLDNQLQEYEKKITDLEKQVEGYKKRPATTAPATQVSPAVGRSTARAIESPVNQADDTILDMKEFKQKGNFKGFGKRVTERLRMK
jgi:hypothetical protein